VSPFVEMLGARDVAQACVLAVVASGAWPRFDREMMASFDIHPIHVPKAGGTTLQRALERARCLRRDAGGGRIGPRCAKFCATYADAAAMDLDASCARHLSGRTHVAARVDHRSGPD